MPARIARSHAAPETLAARRKFLELACACDRAEFNATWRARDAIEPPPQPPVNRWLSVAGEVAASLLPPKFRVAEMVYRLWRDRAERR